MSLKKNSLIACASLYLLSFDDRPNNQRTSTRGKQTTRSLTTYQRSYSQEISKGDGRIRGRSKSTNVDAYEGIMLF